MRNPTIVDRSRVVVDDDGCSEVVACEPFTLRDLLAGMAMQGMLAKAHDYSASHLDNDASEHAMRAVLYADALLSALDKETT